MYRDASNYKFLGDFIVDGQLEDINLRPHLFDKEGHFVPHEVGLDHLLNMPMNEDDHYLHTFEDFEYCYEGIAICTAKEFIEKVIEANQRGWLSSLV